MKFDAFPENDQLILTEHIYIIPENLPFVKG